ncbi:MAG: DUF2079 domain-containing protein [Actinocrinis sp.]
MARRTAVVIVARSIAGLAWAVRCPGVWLSLIAAVKYSSFAVYRVHSYLAGSYDFGVIFQVIHGWAFHGWPTEPLNGPTANEFGDHFAPALAVLAPLLWIHDSPSTIAVAQALLISAAGVPVYLAVRRMHGPLVGSIICATYLVCTTTQDAVGFDIHENMFTPLLLALAVERALAGRWTTAAWIIGALVLCYEDQGLIVILFAVWAALNRKRRHAAVLAACGLLAMILVTAVIMPGLGGNEASWLTRHFPYQKSLHANSFGQAIAYTLEHPRHFWHELKNLPVKWDTIWVLFAPVAFLALFSPITYLASSTVALLLVSDNTTHWQWNYHFFLPVTPIILIGAADALLRFERWGRWLAGFVAARYPAVVGQLRRLRQPERRGAGFGFGWREVVAGLAVLCLCTTVAIEITPHRRPFEALWLYHDGKIHRPPAEIEAITHIASLVPAGEPVNVTNDLGVALLVKDTEVDAPENARYALFDTGSRWCPAGWSQHLATLGFVVVAHDRDVVLMEKK